MQEFTLSRTGDVPVTFQGDRVFSDDTQRSDGPGQNRWHDVTLYRTGKGRYVLAITYRSNWAGEESRDDVLVCGSPVALREEARMYNPIPPNIGYPDGKGYEYKQARMIQDLQVRYEKLVSEMMMAVAGEVAERID